MRLFFIFFILSLVSGCADYRYYEKSNPFSTYEIKSIYIPTFYNHTNLSNAAYRFTREFYILMSQFRGLKITNNPQNADAVLIGVLESPKKLSESVLTTGLRGAKSVSSNSIGSDRQDFYISSSSQVSLTLRIMVLKRPSAQEIRLLQSDLGKQIQPNNKIVFNESIVLRRSFNREYFDEDGSKVHATLNRGALKSTVEYMAKEASDNFRNMILYAF